MRVTSNCANHPSKEASTRCRGCGKWLCDRCLRRVGPRVYCGRRCRLLGQSRAFLARVIDMGLSPISAPWSIAVAAGASALLLTAIGLRIGELIEVNASLASTPDTADSTRDVPAARLGSGVDGVRIEVHGQPGQRFVVVGADGPFEIITTDEDGVGISTDMDPESRPSPLEIIALGPAFTTIEIPPAAAPAPTPTAAPKPPPVSTSPAGERKRVASAPASAPPVLQLIDDAGPQIAITFDGDSSSNRTDELLDVLHELDLQVTLFVTGRFVERHPQVIRRAVLAGHEIGNHTYSHPHLTTYAENRRHRTLPGIDRRTLHNELQKAEQAFRRATGRAMQPLWRAPYGEENRALRGWALEIGYLHVRWSSLRGASLDTRDWVADEHSSLYQSSQKIMQRLLAFPRLEGGIILMPLATERQEAPWTKLPEFVTALRQRGVEPTTVSVLLAASPSWQDWLKRARANHQRINGG